MVSKRLILFFVFVLLSNIPAFAALDQAQLQAAYVELDTKGEGVLTSLNEQERAILLKQVNENPVAALSALEKYDPPPGEVGFCFGRAMAAHLLAHKMGLQRRSILKLFAAGNMQDRGTRWRFHVTTIVRGDDNQWYTIDPVMVDMGHLNPMLPKDWIAEVEKSFVDKAHFPQNVARYYITDPDAVMVDMRVVPATNPDENQQRIIEVSFNPERPGFELEREVGALGDVPVYRVDDDAAEKYFLRRHNRQPSDEFSFLSLDVTILHSGMGKLRHFAYNNFFEDLFLTLR